MWSVNFYAYAQAVPGQNVPPYGNPPINFIKIPDGVSSAGPNGYNATNQVPDQMVVSPQTIADGNMGWTKA